MLDLLKYIPVVVAAVFVGRWFQSEVKKAKKNRAPWYKPYLTPPGIMIILAVIGLPIAVYVVGQ